MENKINIAELLKDCPQGMELDCTMFDDNCMEFNDIVDNKFLPIRCRVKQSNGKYNFYNFTKYGCWIDDDKAKCVIFPKGKTTWEGFQRPFKDGDIISVYNDGVNENFYYKYIAIFKEIKNNCIYVHGLYSYNDKVFSIHSCLCEIKDSTKIKFATEEKKQKLFDVIKANGYKWNAKTKTLEKLIEPKFKVGDRITSNKINLGTIYNIIEVKESLYIVNKNNKTDNYHIDFVNQDYWELVPNKFDITTLKPFDKVLVRDENFQKWNISFFSYYDEKQTYKYHCINDGMYLQCIPYKGNEHLLGTSNDCYDFYKI